MSESIPFKGSGVRLRELRRQLGVDRTEMARRLRVSPQAYNKNDRGITFPGKESLEILEKEYDISMDWLIFGKGPMYYKQERQRVESLEKELSALKQEREQELEQAQTREKEAAGKITVADRPGLKELFAYMERFPMLYHEIMVHFENFKNKIREGEGSTAEGS